MGDAASRELETEREREYSPSSCIGGNYQPYLLAYAERSAQARARWPGRLNLRYGPSEAQQLDLFVPVPGTLDTANRPPPLLCFIHGGYWQELGKSDSSFAAVHCVEQGIAYAALDYTLAPQATVAQMVTECRQAVAWFIANAPTLGFDAKRIVLAGSSAGAQLAAMAAMPAAASASPVAAAILVSGIYTLEPLIGTSINDALGLSLDTARAASPALWPLQHFPPSVVCWGEVETAAFKHQSRDFAARLRTAGSSCHTIEVPQRNHFDVVLELANPAMMLGAATLALIRSL